MVTMPPQSIDDIVTATLPQPRRDNSDEWEKSSEKVEVNHVEEEAEPAKMRDVHTHLYDGLQRKLEQRHMQMIALAGTIGNGLLIGSGKTIAHGGPAGSLLAFMLVGSVTYAMLLSVGEMAVFAPISGGYVHFAERWLHPSVGFALGWQISLQYCVSLGSEMVSACILISFWDTSFPISHQAAYITVMTCFCAGLNFFGVRWFGESEFFFAMIKICLVVGLIVGGLIVDLGGNPTGERIGFRYWKDPGAFAAYFTEGDLGKFLGFFTNLVQAAGAYTGAESIAIAAAEVKNPRVATTKAIKRLFWRIIIFYFGAVLIAGMLVPSNDPNLLQSTGTAASSPFVLAFDRFGIKVLPHVINAAILLSTLSAANSLMYCVSRMIYGLALRGQGPSFFVKTTRNGLPIVSLAFVSLFYGLAFLSLSKGASSVLNWLSNLTALSSYICWACICMTYLRFKRGIEAQGYDRKDFHYHSRLQPYAAWWGIFWCMVVIFFNGWEVFTRGHWSVSNFFIDYISLPFFIGLLVAYQLWRRPQKIPLAELDFVSNIPTDAEVACEEIPPTTWYGKVCSWLFT